MPRTDLPLLNPKHRRRKKTTRMTWAVAILSLVSLVGTFVALGLHWVSETWWVGTIFTYLPRCVLLLPTGALLIGSLIWHRKSLLINAFCVAMVAGPLMGLKASFSAPELPHRDLRVRITTCNVQGYEPDVGQVLTEIGRANPNVVVFQEATGNNGGDRLVKKWFQSRNDRVWHTLFRDSFFVASRWPIEYVATHVSTEFGWSRPTAMHVIVHAPFGSFHLVNLHLMTARHGFSSLNPGNVVGGDAVGDLTGFEVQRDLETQVTREFIEKIPSDLPILLAGDFNIPSFSSNYARHWADWTNCFDDVGFGYGYTAPSAEHRLWPDNTPWLRIDHILANDKWNVHRCRTGGGEGSDHLPLSAIVSLVGARRPDSESSGDAAPAETTESDASNADTLETTEAAATDDSN